MASLCASPSLATDVTLRGRAKLDSRRRLQALKQITLPQFGLIGLLAFLFTACRVPVGL